MNVTNTTSVEYLDHLGTDLTVVNAARASFGKESDWETNADGTYAGPTNRLKSEDADLIRFLATGHVMRWMNPYPPPEAFVAHSIRDTWKAMLATGGFFSVVMLLSKVACDDSGLPLAFLSALSFTSALWGMHKERQALVDYITWKHFS